MAAFPIEVVIFGPQNARMKRHKTGGTSREGDAMGIFSKIGRPPKPVTRNMFSDKMQ